ncbi:aldo/keto reductase (plasmid) [Streptomyces murinus]|uniref:aldo/keto reductase n=1 Tax=Streptomyces murinus TaxID=33900 RepID=UPI000A1F5E64|nr:aldo/keto reductase [Streptomyces murinus]WDO11207.1 aldo/keto reductase [Streptomyces murinus]
MSSTWVQPSNHTLYRRSGRTGLHLPMLSLGLGRGRHRTPIALPSLVRKALELGINSFDITAPYRRSHEFYAEVRSAFSACQPKREEFFVSVRIGLGTGPLPFAGYSSRRQLLAGVDGLLRDTALDYVDILYLHRLDPQTPLTEATTALADAIRLGKALYPGLSAFSGRALTEANAVLTSHGTPAAALQVSYSLMDRWAEEGLLDTLAIQGIGGVACAPMAHGQLTTGRKRGRFMPGSKARTIETLTQLAAARGQTLEQLAISWALRDQRISSALLTTTDHSHLAAVCEAVHHTDFTAEELVAFDACCPIPAFTIPSVSDKRAVHE